MVATSKSNGAEVIVVSQGMIVVVSFVKCLLQIGLSNAEKIIQTGIEEDWLFLSGLGSI